MPDETPLTIHGFGAPSFRTFDDVRVRLGRLTVITGANNSGKSSLLELLELHPRVVSSLQGRRPSDGEGTTITDRMYVRVPLPISFFEERLEWFRSTVRPEASALIERFLEEVDHEVWITTLLGTEPVGVDLAPTETWIRTAMGRMGVEPESRASTILEGALELQDEHTFGFTFVKRAVASLPKPSTVTRITDVRRTAAEPLEPDQLWKLARESSFDTTRRRVKRWTASLELILKDVFGPDVTFAVHPEESSGRFLLRIDGQDDVPLDHVGAGVREVVAIAYRALSSERRTVLAIEEPENCLHPTAARRLILALLRRTQAQLIVTTHAAGIVNSDPEVLIQVERSGSTSTARMVEGDTARYESVRALGYQPSDLVLTPCAVWVEGPSDRKYLQAWLGQHGLVDGLDFHIMFTAGAVATHLSAEPEALDEVLVALRAFSRRCAIVVDSDRRSQTDGLKPHVVRFQEETADDHGLCIVTWGREIENYLERDAVNDILAVRGVRPVRADGHRWARVLPATGATIGKLTFARAYIEATNGAIPSAAESHIQRIAEFIKASPEAD